MAEVIFVPVEAVVGGGVAEGTEVGDGQVTELERMYLLSHFEDEEENPGEYEDGLALPGKGELLPEVHVLHDGRGD